MRRARRTSLVLGVVCLLATVAAGETHTGDWDVTGEITASGNFATFGDSSYVVPFPGWSGSSRMVAVRQPTAVSSGVSAGFMFSNNQTSGAFKNIAQLMFLNEASVMADKRVAQILVQTGGNINSGKMFFRVYDSGSATDALVINRFGGTTVKFADLYTQTTAFMGAAGGGSGNIATGTNATVGGGAYNIASGDSATVGGGMSNVASDDFSTVAGGYSNQAGDAAGTTSDAPYATVGGGYDNSASAGHSTIGGGDLNLVTDDYGTIGGGGGNQAGDAAGTTADAYYATVGGGGGNVASGNYSSVLGGWGNTAGPANEAAVAGGYLNTASGIAAFVGGGGWNDATGDYSFAAGRNANASDDYSFVWNSDSSTHSSAATSTFNVWASGGIYWEGGAVHTTSDRNKKENFEPVDSRAVLAKVAALPMSTWNYKTEDGKHRHMGPMGQDFRAAFGLGTDDKHITTVDADGVALAAIQGLYEAGLEKDAQIASLEARLAALEEAMAKD